MIVKLLIGQGGEIMKRKINGTLNVLRELMREMVISLRANFKVNYSLEYYIKISFHSFI